MDRGAWRPTVHEVAKSWTLLKWLSTHRFHRSPLSLPLWPLEGADVLHCLPQAWRCSVQFSSVTQSWPTLCDTMDCSTPGFPVLHYLLQLTQTHVNGVHDAIQPPHHLSPPFCFGLQSFPASGSFPMSQLFTLGGQNIGVSASASVLSMNIQGWFPLGLTGWIFSQSKGLSRPISNTTVQKHQFFGAQLYL